MKSLSYFAFFNLFTCLCSFGSNAVTPLELRGLAKLDEAYMFSIHDVVNNQSKWMEKGQTFAGFTLNDYDPSSSTIFGYYDNNPVQLVMVESELFGKFIPENEKFPLYNKAEVDRLVRDFREREFANLPDESDPLFNALKQSAENRIISYESGLLNSNQSELAKSDESSITDGTASSNIKPRIGSQRKQNNVNSRIWASDHIEEFGVPSI